ncbi:hypothetical protein BU26DRAFT_120735 [Trematosphaeria pertusa]|uniref:F-box domain-containing protein n=1 Tax=Trematosphaeria pertusa TaxID=390896 RepID=A0A6A6HYC5_9PLEO|nr:uncharacterized protein BU26DRAFT_120735 [Trematosphaeria pertusa]KAF2242889.1 hypothetical protein BU26DRAFT_120735 [Trematosphaeria pertusa]
MHRPTYGDSIPNSERGAYPILRTTDSVTGCLRLCPVAAQRHKTHVPPACQFQTTPSTALLPSLVSNMALLLAPRRSAAEQPALLRLPLCIRTRIYTYIIQKDLKSPLESFPLAFVCRQIQAEFVAAYEYRVNARFRCCLGRTAQDPETTRLYAWNYHTSPWSSAIELTPSFAAKLKACKVRCTIEELGDWERRSEPGTECFKDCIRILVRTFKTSQHLHELRVSFDHFILSGKKGLLEADEVWDRLKGMCEMPALKEIEFETPGLGEDFRWRKERSAKKGKGREEWVRIVEESGNANVQVGARAPKGYGLRRGIT